MFVSSVMRARASVAAVSRISSGAVTKNMPAGFAMNKMALGANTQSDLAVANRGLLAPHARHGGVSVLGCAIAMVAVGGCAQGMGQLFAGMVVAIARNPSMKDDLFTYTFIGLGFVELLAMVVIIVSLMLLNSE